MAEKTFKLGWPLAIIVVVLLVVFKGGLFSKGDVDLAITDDVLQNKWKPVIRQELRNHYNNKYMLPMAGDSSKLAEMAALVQRIDALQITGLSLQQKGARSSSWVLSNKPGSVYVNVQYEMPGGTPDGITSREIKVALRGLNDIARIERM